MADPVTSYAYRVLSGEILANRWVRLACQRHLDDLTRPELYFDTKRAQQVIDFFRLILKLSSGSWEGMPFVLLDFQEFIQGSVFGWYWKDAADRWVDRQGSVHYKRRRFEVVYYEGAKGVGKSPQAAGTSIYCAIGDGIPRAECFLFASKKEQAYVSFKFAEAMVDLSPLLKDRFIKAGKNPCWQLTDPHTRGSYIKPIAKGNKLSGPDVHFAGGDELHEHPDDTMLSMMRQGMKGTNPLLYLTTNSGSDRTSVCYQQRQQACNMLEGVIPNDALFAYICGLDDPELKAMGLMKLDKEDADIEQYDPIDYLLAHEELWQKANPSIGRVRGYDYVRKRLEEAKGLPAQRNRVLRLNFSIWTDALSVWIPDSMWMGCARRELGERVEIQVPQKNGTGEGQTGAAGAPQVERVTRLEQELIGKRCYGGIDLARGAGFHALVLIFPDDEGVMSQEVLDARTARGEDLSINTQEDEAGGGSNGRAPSVRDPNNQLYSLLEYYFMDEEAYKKRVEQHSILSVWRDRGELIVWPEVVALGNLLDYITTTITPRYRIDSIAYDPAFMSPQMTLNLQQAGLVMVEWAQQYRLMDAPITEVERRAKVGLLRHRGHPVTRWMMGNVRIVEDRGGRKLIDKSKISDTASTSIVPPNVDGPSALCTGLGLCMRMNQGPVQVRSSLARSVGR